MKKYFDSRDKLREKFIGLGKDSIHKSYYPQLQEHIKELEEQKKVIEEQNINLIAAMNELKETQAQLVHSEEKFRTLFENAQDAIFILDDKATVVDYNPQALIVFNTEDEYIINRSTSYSSAEIQPDGRLSGEAAIYYIKLVLGGIPQIFNWLFKNYKGEHIYTRVALNRIDIDDKPYLQAIVRDITKEKQLERDLMSATIKTEEKERARFAKELHDGVGPILSTIKLYFQWLAESDDVEQRKIIIEKGNNNISEAIKALREVSNKLSPHILLNYGLIEGLKQFIEVIIETGILNITLNQAIQSRFENEIEITLYRVITELINNTIKHAEATEITINILLKENILLVEYSDNGKGAELEKVLESKSGLGMHNMKNRINNIGGIIDFISGNDSGFEASISLNLTQQIEK